MFADLRFSASDPCVSKDEILKMATRLGLDYYETSALTMTGLKDCFDNAVSIDCVQKTLIIFFSGFTIPSCFLKQTISVVSGYSL